MYDGPIHPLRLPRGHTCCIEVHQLNPFHKIERWAGTFFEDYSLRLFTIFEDDFLQDNVECGTSAMNYYSKIQRMTSSMFPHLVPDRYRELLRVSRAWRNLKLLKWKGFYPGSCNPDRGGLVLFCPTCPQPGINIPEMDDVELSQWVIQTIFTSKVLIITARSRTHGTKNAGNETWLMDGQGYMVASQDYKTYLGGTTNKIMH
ncbi:hypothetical protein EDC04DRAFT_2605643 [Pisolithus marmoratus]|nr:hypothetical protein EDC04DRAFT_2605643 [Pisolithus marmoratus]